MKRLICFTISLLLLFCLFTSCASKEYRITDGDRVYQIRETGRNRTVEVYENDLLVWETKVKISSTVKSNDELGLSVLDLNFDGYSDIMVETAKSDDKISQICYLQNPSNGRYEESPALAELYTVDVVADQQLVLSYTGVYADVKTGITTESVIAYRWQNDGLIPYRKLSITYYPTEDRYCFGASDYLDSSLRFDEPDERWFSPEEYSQADWSFFYYFK